MPHASRTLLGAPGGILSGFVATDPERHLLAGAAHGILGHLDALWLRELLDELDGLLPEVDRMRAEMGPERMRKDTALLELRRASCWAAWVLQREWAHLQAWFAPDDPEMRAFAPQDALTVGVSSHQRRVARLDALRQAYRACTTVPDAEARANALAAVSTRLFRASAEAAGGAAEPVPLAEARQRFDLAYATVRDAVVARRRLSPESVGLIFPDLSPAWRWERLSLETPAR